ncbi:hypothetical protein [Clostridium vincentii]|uniref:Lipoprotein n=1 Tax=Clostridium vincentii TaxID=52704 RepID=A0A2T0BEL6_9CLOT|nr:hypothetical protein [Clostridium vincentii]PRR82257.1 hypothetical protein CLVI_19170 [Clostridium vincentii]
MKRYFKILIIMCMTITLFVGCGKNVKDSTQNRVEGSTFTFTAEEFKNYYNDSIGLFDSELKDFTGDKSESADYYQYIEIIGNYVIYATSATDGGKLTRLQISYKGGTEKEPVAGMSQTEYNENDIEKFMKKAGNIFDICETTTPTEDFNNFSDENLNGYVLENASKEIGDLTISFNMLSDLSFKFEPKEVK